MDNNIFGRLLLFATPIAATISVLYLFSYWTVFNINIFNYLTLNQILITSIDLYIGTVFGIITLFLFRPRKGYSVEDYNEEYYTNKKSEHFKKISKLKSKYIIKLGCYMIVSLTFLVLIIPINKAIYIMLIIGIVIVTCFNFFLGSFIKKQLNEKFNLRMKDEYFTLISTILIVYTIAPVYIGVYRSSNILTNKYVNYVRSDLIKTSDNKIKDSKLKYLGVGGDNYIFLSLDNSTVHVIKQSEVPILSIQKAKWEGDNIPIIRIVKWFTDTE